LTMTIMAATTTFLHTIEITSQSDLPLVGSFYSLSLRIIQLKTLRFFKT